MPLDGPDTGHVVYFIAAGSYVKIGYSADVRERLRGLQTANPLPLELVHTIGYKTEADARKMELAWRGRIASVGRPAEGEWVNLDLDVVGQLLRASKPLRLIKASELFRMKPPTQRGLVEAALRRVGLRADLSP